jgi:hypothetical protein
MSDTSDEDEILEAVEVNAITGEVTRRPLTAEELADLAAMAQTPPTPEQPA